MKNIILKSLLLALIYTFSANAAVYKGVDEDGNVIYSDTPINNAKKFTPPSLTIMDAPKVQPKKEVSEDAETDEFKYTKFSITAPKNDEVIWNNPQLTVALKLKPALNVEAGHTTWLLMDGKVLVKKSRSLLLQIGRADRGEHKLQAQIRDKKGKIIKRTKTVIVHIKNTVVPRPTPRAN